MRVMVLSVKLSSARDSLPVRTVEDLPMIWPELADLASFELSLTFTSFTVFEITADLNGAADKTPTANEPNTIQIKFLIFIILMVTKDASNSRTTGSSVT